MKTMLETEEQGEASWTFQKEKSYFYTIFSYIVYNGSFVICFSLSTIV
jgi:hypothetical protein